MLVPPSPKFQLQEVSLLPVLSSLGQMKRTGSGSAPIAGLAANRTVGASTAMVAGPLPSVEMSSSFATVRLTS